MRSTGALTNGALQPAVRTMAPITAALPNAMPALLLLRAIKNSPFLRARAPAAHQGEADQNGLAELPRGLATHSIHFAIPPASSMTFLARA